MTPMGMTTALAGAAATFAPFVGDAGTGRYARFARPLSKIAGAKLRLLLQ
jgi:hypothetical protein